MPTVEEGGAVGVSLADLSRTISYEMINDPEALEKVKEHIISSTAPVIWQNSKIFHPPTHIEALDANS